VTPEQAEAAIKETLAEVAPDADISALAPDADMRDTLELDSMDFLRVIEILSERCGRIDEDDYPQLATLSSAVKFLAGREAR
jgi:acyl carrier protein